MERDKIFSIGLSSILGSKFFIDALALDCDEEIQFYEKQVMERSPHLASKVVYSGSVADNLALTMPKPDADIMLVSIQNYIVVDWLTFFPCSNYLQSIQECEGIFRRACLSDTHPGYVMLVEGISVEQEEIHFVSNSKFNLVWKDVFQQNKGRKKFLIEHKVDETYSSHGPAIQAYFSTPEGRGLDADMVNSLWYPGWPAEALPWLYRQRKARWPSQELIQQIVWRGCHLVGNGYPLSAWKEAEWRTSFSRAEMVLARSLTFGQRVCYLAFKAMCKVTFTTSALSTYHFKTTLFWLCEEIPAKFWTLKYLAHRLGDLFRRLIHFLVQHNLPNYFIPENNMISHIHVDTIRTVLKCALVPLQNPLLILQCYLKEYKSQSRKIDWLYNIVEHLQTKVVEGRYGLSEFFLFWADVSLSCIENNKAEMHNFNSLTQNAHHFLRCAHVFGFCETERITKEHLISFIQSVAYYMKSQGILTKQLYYLK